MSNKLTYLTLPGDVERQIVDESVRANLIAVQNTQPTSGTNKLWINSSNNEEIEIPTWQEHEELADEVTEIKENISQISDALEKAKNLVIPETYETGCYYTGWTIGQPEHRETNATYVTVKADLSDIKSGYITCNSDAFRNSFLLYLDKDSKVISLARDSQDTSKSGWIYAVPNNAKYLRISYNNGNGFADTTGFVVFDGSYNISNPMLTKYEYPYGVPLFYADNINLKSGGTVGEAIRKIYHVEKNGSGDFTKLTDAINEATKYMDSVVYVGDGVWDIVDEYGNSEMESMNKNKRGLYLKNRIHVICSSKSIIRAKYTGTNDTVREWFSAFNAGEYGFTLENATIETDNIRYCVHDERDADADTYKNHYINCTMTHTNGFYNQCIGGGLGLDGHIIIDGCRFKGKVYQSINTSLVSYHNSADGAWDDTSSKGAKSFIDIHGCYFSDKGMINLINFGKSDKMTTAIIHDNSFGGALELTNGSKYYQQNIQMLAWNNEIRN